MVNRATILKPRKGEYRSAKQAGLSDIDAIRMLRSVFGLSLGDAKEAMIVGSGVAKSLREHEDAIADQIRSEGGFDLTPEK